MYNMTLGKGRNLETEEGFHYLKLGGAQSLFEGKPRSVPAGVTDIDATTSKTDDYDPSYAISITDRIFEQEVR